MLQPNQQAPPFSLSSLDGGERRYEFGKPALLVFFETDCPTCRLTFPYLSKL
nr:redoxin domain-containing protein [Acidobacteriota bacterium]